MLVGQVTPAIWQWTAIGPATLPKTMKLEFLGEPKLIKDENSHILIRRIWYADTAQPVTENYQEKPLFFYPSIEPYIFEDPMIDYLKVNMLINARYEVRKVLRRNRSTFGYEIRLTQLNFETLNP